jgi:hypothetical protein
VFPFRDDEAYAAYSRLMIEEGSYEDQTGE